MWAETEVTDRALGADDKVAASSLYDAWSTPTGSARDIAAATGIADIAWIIGTTPQNGGYQVMRSSGSGFVPDAAGGGGVVIAATSSGIPWVVNDRGEIWRRGSNLASSSSWSRVPGCARDIAIGVKGEVFIISCDRMFGGFAVHQYSSATNSFVSMAPNAGSRIAVHADGQPWVINETQQIWRRLANGSWQQLPGPAYDITGDGDGYMYVVGTDPRASGYGLYVWNEQVARFNTPARPGAWLPMTTSGVGTNIAVGFGGSVWTTTSSNGIRRTTR